MPLVGELVERIDDAALASADVIVGISHVFGDGIGGFESDAPDVVRQAIRILLYLLYGFLAVSLVNLGGVGAAHAIALQEDHDVLDVLLLFPRLGDEVDAFFADSIDFSEPLDILLYNLQRLLPELSHNLLGIYGTDALDETAAQVFLDAHDGGRHLLGP